MKNQRPFILLLLVLASTSLAASQAVKPQHFKKLKYPPLREIKIPEPLRFELANGMVVYLLEDHSLPTVNGSVLVRTGSRYEPADKVGLASLTGQVMRTGGTMGKTGDEIDEMLEKVAASVETFIGTTTGGASVFMLKENIDLGLSALADVLRNPAFREEKIDLAKIAARSGISRRNDEVGGIAGREFSRLIYGPQHPYARQTEYATIENITRQDMIDFHKAYYVPNNMIIAFWGDFDSNDMKNKLEQAFGAWPKGSASLPPVPQPRMAQQMTVNFIKKDDVNQSQIRIGHLGGMLNDPESAALNVANQAFGGAFASRLFKTIRSDQGLAYAIGSSWGQSFDYPGIFQISGSTKSGTTVKMIQSIRKEVEDVFKKGITAEELRFAKDRLLNSFVFQYDTKAKVINQLMTLEYYGYPKDFIRKQQKDIQNATLESVSQAIKNRWKPGAMALLVVGKESDFDQPMAALSPNVRTIDITIPSPPEKIPDPTPETIGKGKEILKKAVSAMGGKAVTDLKDMHQKVAMMQSTPMGDLTIDGEMTMAKPNKMMMNMQTPMGSMTMVYDGNSAWMKTGQGVQDLSGSQKEELQKQITENMYSILGSFDSPSYTVQYLKDDAVDGKTAHVIVVRTTGTNSSVKLYIDAKTAMIVKKVSRRRMQGGPTDVEESYSDYRAVNGVQVPYKTVGYAEGKKVSETTVKEISVNAGVKEELFKR